uniref:SKP1-like protein 20 n=1 Tax=Erigeron canadensis TaxID=72917 RepID=UPI001CB9A609|nr:SKP1-like protein 20 [Erigeron canadensis]
MSNKKKTTTAWRHMYLKLHDGPVMVDETLTMESDLLRRFYESEYHGLLSLKIKNSIYKKVIEFCKKRAEIRIQHSNSDNDEKVLQDKLKDFDAEFIKQFYQSNDENAILYLMDAACKLVITSLLDLLLDDIVEIISRKSPEDIKNFFFVHYNGNDRLFNNMKEILTLTRWVLK